MGQVRARRARRRRASRLWSVVTASLCIFVVTTLAACTSSDAGSAPTGPERAPSSTSTPATPTASASPAPPAEESPSPSNPAEVARVRAALRTQTIQQSGVVLDALIERSSTDDPRYYSDGMWHDGDSGCFRCHYGPAVLSASYGVVAHDPIARQRAIQSINLAIKRNQGSDGSFNAPGVTDGPEIQTTFFGFSLAQTYLTLGSSLDAASAKRWRRSLAAAAHYLDNSGWTSWYANGNLVLAETAFFSLTSKIIGTRWYADQTDQLYGFLIAPPQARWAGFGLTYTKQPTAANGSDGSAFLAEKGSGFPGFDSAYGMLQLALATDWFIFTRDPRALRLANLLINQLLPRVRESDWTIDIGGGTRRGTPGARYGFTSPGLPVLAILGGRTDLVGAVLSQAVVRGKTYRDATGFVSPGNSYSFGLEMGALLWAVR